MKQKIKYGGVLHCDMVTLVDTRKDLVSKEKCKEAFVTYSVASLVRSQAERADLVRVKAGRVKWPGEPPCGNGKKVDLCPTHSACVITEKEAKAKRAAEREAKKLEKAKPKRKRKKTTRLDAPKDVT